MRNIALLIRKDFISSVATYGAYIVFLLVWVVVAPLAPHMLPLMFTMCLYLLVLALFQSEENDLVCNVRAILPIRKRHAVIARYVYALAVIGLMALYACIACPLASLLRGQDNNWPLFLGVALMTNLLLMSISAPLMYRMSIAKSRLVITTLYVLFIIAASSLSPMLMSMEELPIEFSPAVFLTVGVAASLVLMLASMGISMKVVR